MDHFSKKILGYSVEEFNSSIAVKQLLKEAVLNYKPMDNIKFITDGGSENVNQTVSEFLDRHAPTIKHLVAQRDIQFSNSSIEMFNKVIKHQFLLPHKINNRNHLIQLLAQSIPIYNDERPQWSLAGNTPNETYYNTPIDFSRFSTYFKDQKTIRIAQNQQNSCKICLKE